MVGRLLGAPLVAGGLLARLVANDEANVVLRVPIAERLCFCLLDVEAESAEHGERGDGEEGGTHLVYLKVRGRESCYLKERNEVKGGENVEPATI